MTFRLLQADRAVGRAGVGAVVGGHSVMDREHNPVSGVALKLSDVPGSGSSHEKISGGTIVTGD